MKNDNDLTTDATILLESLTLDRDEFRDRQHTKFVIEQANELIMGDYTLAEALGAAFSIAETVRVNQPNTLNSLQVENLRNAFRDLADSLEPSKKSLQ